MAKREQTRIELKREETTRRPTVEEIDAKAAEGWQLAAVVWRREVPDEEPSPDMTSLPEETPYGLVTTDGGVELREDLAEEEALRLMLRMVIDDQHDLSQVADELNRRGHLTRGGEAWSPLDVFNMLPRLVEVAPRFYARSDWTAEGPTLH